MAAEPMNIFSHRIDPAGVAQLARKLDPGATVNGPDDDWQTIEFTPIKRGLLRRKRKLVLGHQREYYAGDEWSRQILGMGGYFGTFPDTPAKMDIMRLIGSFQFSLAVPVEDDLHIDSDDERLEPLFAICKYLDGVFFLPSSLRDQNGKVLIDRSGSPPSPGAVFPDIPPEAVLIDVTQVGGDEDDDNEDDASPPTAERVARRALAMTALCARATLELDSKEIGVENAEMHRDKIMDWVEQLRIGDELEPDEWKVIQRGIGKLGQQDLINAMWRVEGLVILAWALGLTEPPPYDQLVTPPELYESLGLFEQSIASEILASPVLRDRDELAAMNEHLLAFHWRLRDFSLRRQKMDFVKFSRDCWFGSFDISQFNIIRGDLALGGIRIDKADTDALGRASSTAMERHQAINWLHGGSEVYSETDTST